MLHRVSTVMVDWTWTPDTLEEFQRRLAVRWLAEPRWQPPLDRPTVVGGVFVASARGNEGPGSAGDDAWAAAVLIEAKLELSDRSRTPAPLREARRLARTARAHEALE